MRTCKISLQVSLSIFLYTLLSTPCLSSKLCNPDDKAALLQFSQHYFGNISTYWKSDDADADADADCCKDWEGVKCDRHTNRVTTLSLSNGQLSGEISSALGDLPYLKTLHIRKQPNITGTIPNSIVKLQNLKFLRFDWNNLSGPVPSFLSQLKKLHFLDLSFNRFSGSIPPSLSTLPDLYSLHLDRNQLTGSIPDSFGSFKLTNISIYLSHNNLSGSIPTTLGSAHIIDFSRNKLTGDASFLFRNNNISRINLARNLLEFNMTNVEFGFGLNIINLNHNNIYGSIPLSLATLPQLQSLNVSYNHLCGPIPTGGGFVKLDQSSYIHNRCLCGVPMPPCI
ncbi:polygalacturonase inhibitor-like [Spinacia oleracea]|uniref:Polygalacturonase inhibitor-like n=1 Tax=Spinacia oleracea TaxID=3562 RepID=A0A9R0IQX6_SPIOL|nr:polygalacturonase inhibitor-like [Spinacia oleracea]